jgi:hypothetical protein
MPKATDRGARTGRGVRSSPRLLAAVGLLAAAGAARAGDGLSLELSFGAPNLGLARPTGVAGPVGLAADLGTAAFYTKGPFAVGLAASGQLANGGFRSFDASALAGIVHPLPPYLRIELFGEAGLARQVSLDDVDAAVSAAATHDRFYGFRPGISVKLPSLPFRFGLWGLVRWHHQASPAPAYGMLGRIGFDF